MRKANVKGLKAHLRSARLFLTAFMLAFAAPAFASAYSTTALKEKDIKRAEKIIVKLRRLEAASAPNADSRARGAETANLYPGLFVDASELGESDLKTDLTTAVFLYERARRAAADPGARLTDCDGETRGIYLKLCLEGRDGEGSPAGLLHSKARLHTRWAEAVVRFYRGATGPETLAELLEIETERKVDLVLAGEALASLKRVAARAGDYPSVEAFEGALRAQNISFDDLSHEIAEALSAVDRALASLPRGRLRLLLHNARCGYADALFWWGKTHPTRAKTVSVNNLVAADPLKVAGLAADVANNTVLANWRNALRYTREAEKLIGERRL